MRRTAVEGYTGVGKPPCVVMVFKAKSDKTTPPDFDLSVILTGVRKQKKELLIHRPAEGNVIFAKLIHDWNCLKIGSFFKGVTHMHAKCTTCIIVLK